MSIGQELLNVPMGDMIKEMAFAIAEAQVKLDEASVETAEMMGGLKTIVDDNDNVTFEDSRVFFGSEYMTVAEALVTQALGQDGESSEDGKAALGAIKNAGVKFRFKRFGSGPDVTPVVQPDYTKDATNDDDPHFEMESFEDYNTFLTARDAYHTELRAALDGKTDPEKGNINKLIEINNSLNDEAFGMEIKVPTRISLLELGFAPVFYSFVDTIIEVKISISMTRSSSYSRSSSNRVKVKSKKKAYARIPFFAGKKSKKKTVSTSQVNAGYSSRYSYTAEGSSLLRTKLAPIPTPPLLEERIRALMDAEQERQQLKLDIMRAEALPAPA